jgi:hypothetical protein
METALTHPDTVSVEMLPQSDGALSFDSLVSFHKQESSEEMTYVTIVFTIVLGVLAFVGSANSIGKMARIVLAVTVTITLLYFAVVLLASLRIHDALHVEIMEYAKKNPDVFIKGTDSKLYQALTDLEISSKPGVIAGFLGIWSVTLLAILFMGNGGFKISWKKFRQQS